MPVANLRSLLRVWTAVAAIAISAWTAPASAQGTPLSSLLPELLGNTITLVPSNLPDQPSHIAHFRPGTDQLQVPSQVNRALLTMLSTYPLGSPSGGFTLGADDDQPLEHPSHRGSLGVVE